IFTPFERKLHTIASAAFAPSFCARPPAVPAPVVMLPFALPPSAPVAEITQIFVTFRFACAPDAIVAARAARRTRAEMKLRRTPERYQPIPATAPLRSCDRDDGLVPRGGRNAPRGGGALRVPPRPALAARVPAGCVPPRVGARRRVHARALALPRGAA